LTDTTDTWWSTNWNNNDVRHFDTGVLEEGRHTILLYFLEGCCDGNNDVRFRINLGDAYYELTGFSDAWDTSKVACRSFETKYVTE